MKVRYTFTVDDADRYLIATYFREVLADAELSTPNAWRKKRRRATRAQVKLFATAALNLALNDRLAAASTPKRVRTIAHRIRARQSEPHARPALTPPSERNRRLFE